jgi:plastocyanin
MNIPRLLLIALVVAPCAVPAKAGSLTVNLVDQSGRAVRDAVVIVRPVGHAAPLPRKAGGMTVEQRGLQFHPLLSVVPVGTSVSFPNFDKTRHHVYSFSPAKKFELKLFASEQSRSVTFDKPGVVAVGCNIHDQMSAFIYVTDSAWTARSNGRGQVTIADLPAERVTVTVFHPYLRAPGSLVGKPLALGNGSATTSFALKLRAPVAMGHGY